jgi:hypothetical protein
MDPQVVHPIVEAAVLSLDPLAGDHFARVVRKKLRTIDDGDELQSAVISLTSLAKRLDDAGNADAADRVLDLACEAIEPLKVFGADARRLAEDLTRTKTAQFRAFSSEDTAARAPLYGARPRGTLKLSKILPPRPRRA